MSDASALRVPLRVSKEWSVGPVPSVLAALAILPLVTYVLLRAAPRVLLQANGGLGFISELEQPLTIESLPGRLALLGVLGWLALAYRSRVIAFWEPVLVLAASGFALVRLGNLWCVGLLLLLPLAQQIGRFSFSRAWWLAVGASLLVLNVALGILARPPSAPPVAAQTIAQLAPSGARVLAYQPWAASLQAQLGVGDAVVDASPLETWPQADVDMYQHVSLGGLGWEDSLVEQKVSFLVLDPTSAQSWLVRQVPLSTRWHVVLDSPSYMVAEVNPS